MALSEIDEVLDLMHAWDHAWPIIELFGPTIQGEGAMAGVPTMFLRFGGCGYRCNWCDTMYAVDPHQVRENRTMMTCENIVAQINATEQATKWMTFSGGDPCMQPHVGNLIRAIKVLTPCKKIAVEIGRASCRERV